MIPPKYMDTLPDVVIVCGGKGTRFQSVVPNQPKSMAPIHGRPFLDLLLEMFFAVGFRRYILCVGYMADAIKKYYQKGPFAPFIIFSEEKEPLGTAGALKAAEDLFISDDVVVSNGDSYCAVDLVSFLAFHRLKTDGVASIVLTPGKGRRDAGDVVMDPSTHRITAFQEKSMNGAYFVSAGIYCLQRSALTAIPAKKNYSIEYDFFPQFLSRSFYGFVTESPCLDIGTPERYKAALAFFQKR